MDRRFPTLARALSLCLALPGIALAAKSPAPDSEGYGWRDSDEPGVDTRVPASTRSNLRIQGYSGDNAVIRVTLPLAVFPAGFPYRGARYPRFWLSTNGWLSFVDPAGNSAPTPATLPGGLDPNATVAFFWNDWTADGTSPLAEGGPTNANDGYVLQLRLYPRSSPNTIGIFNVVLFHSGLIKLVYNGDVTRMTAGTHIGTENGSGTVGLPYMIGGTPQGGARFTTGYAVEYHGPLLDCVSNVATLGCPQPTTVHVQPTGSNRVPQYHCATGIYDASEMVFRLDLTQTMNLTMTVKSLDGRSRKLFWIGASCDQFSGCLGGGQTTLKPNVVPPGTYYLVVDGEAAADGGQFELTVDCVDWVIPLACNTNLLGQATSGTSGLTNWSPCTTRKTGPENVYAVTVSGGPLTLQATLNKLTTPDQWVILSDPAGFDPATPSCLRADLDQVTQLNVSNGTVFVTVDGQNGAQGSYDLNIECGRRLVCPSPANAIDVTNPAPVAGDTRLKSNDNTAYQCADAGGGSFQLNGYTGNEEVWEFTLTQPTTVNFELSSSSSDMRLFLLGDCYEGSCVTPSTCGENLAPGTYRLVVDSLNGFNGPYTITPQVGPPAGPYNLWFTCPVNQLQSPADEKLKTWAFRDGTFCGTGCDFSLFAVVPCGSEFHIPLNQQGLANVATGHMRIFDVLRQVDVDITADNGQLGPCGLREGPATQVGWDDQTCTQIPCPPPRSCGGGRDCRTKGQRIDVAFPGRPTACGVYRVDFLNFGGNSWDVKAGCSAETPGEFYLYRDLCGALADYQPLPEVAIVEVVHDNLRCQLDQASGTLKLRNVGCVAVAGYEVTIAQQPPDPPNPKTITVDLLAGEEITVPWVYHYSALRPIALEFNLDPGSRVAECSEALGTTIACGAAPGARQVRTVACPQGCTTVAEAGNTGTVCEGATYRVNGNLSTFSCLPGGTAQYRWEDSNGDFLPGCDWSGVSICNIQPLNLRPGPNTFTLRTRCDGNVPFCLTDDTVDVVVNADLAPGGLGNVLMAVKESTVNVELDWTGVTVPAHGFRIYKDGNRDLGPGTRVQWSQVLPTVTRLKDVDAVPRTPTAAFYQLVGISCGGNREGPY